jgi:glycosyltransferase involved in cell wall biosynthesis
MAQPVVHVIQSLVTGGAERVVVEYARSHDRDRYAPVVCTVRGGGALEEDLERIGVPVHVLGRPGWMRPGPLVKLARILGSLESPIVHGHNFAGTSLAAPAAALAGAAAVVRTEHNVVATGSHLRWLVSRAAAVREDAQIAVSDCARASHVDAGRIGPERFVTVWNGIGEERVAASERRGAVRAGLGLDDETLLFLSVGSLTLQKDHRGLIEAAAKVRDPRVFIAIAGDGPLQEELSERIRSAQCGDRVALLGRRLDVPDLLRAADAFVLGSRFEGLPITVLEAMAAGVPCVATSVGGVPEAIDDGRTGLLVPAGDPDALAGAIDRLAGDGELREQLAAAARSTYEGAFRAEQMVRQSEALYEVACSRRADLASGERIKVVYVIGQLEYGGTERQLVELAGKLPRERFEPVVCSLTDEGPMAEELRKAGVRVVSLGKRRGVASGALGRLVRLLRRERPAVLHTFLFSANWRGVIAGRLARVPVVVTSYRNVDIHSRSVPIAVERLLSGWPDYVIVNARAVGEHVAAAHGVREDRVRVIYNGVDVARVERTRKSRPPGARRTVVMIATLTEKKDPLCFVEVAALVARRTDDVEFRLVGEGPLRERVEALARERGLGERFTAPGVTSDIGGVLESADVSVLTSLKEGCSNALLESMAAGVPVVVTDVGGNPELVEDGVTGFIVPPREPETLAERIIAILEEPPLAARMGRAARERALDRFSVDVMVGRTTEFYEEAIERAVPGLVGWVDISAARRAAAGRE